MRDKVERDLLIDAPVEAVWPLISEPVHVGSWFSDEATFDSQPGARGLLGWREGAESHASLATQAVSVPIQIEAVEPPRRFAIRWLHPEGEPARAGNSLLVEFTLTDEGGQTLARVSESGITQIGWDEAEMKQYLEDHHTGWDSHLAHLRDYVAQRQGRNS